MDRIRERSELGLRDVRPIERPRGMPDSIDLATAVVDGDRPVVVVASRRDGVDLLGWGYVASRLATGRRPEELILAAPVIGTFLRKVAAAASHRTCSLRLVSVPVLAEATEGLFEDEVLPRPADIGGWRPSSTGLIERVLRIVEGAAILSGVAAVRETSRGYVLYVRGVLCLAIAGEGEGVGVECLVLTRRHLHVTEVNLPRLGLDLHELILQLAQDPRLLDRVESLREPAVEMAAAAAGVRITTRWMPWSTDGADPIDWLGIDGSGRPVIGLVRPRISLVHVAAVMTAVCRLDAEPGAWTPGAHGTVQVALASDDVDGDALAALEAFDIDVEARPLDAQSRSADEAERRGRRRPRRRRRPRAGEPFLDGAAEVEGAESRDFDREPEPLEAGSPAEPEAEDERQPRRGRGRRRRRGGESSRTPTEADELPQRTTGQEATSGAGAGDADSAGTGDADSAGVADADSAGAAAAEFDAIPDAGDADSVGTGDADSVGTGDADSVGTGDADAPAAAIERLDSERVEMEIEATLAEVPAGDEEIEPEPLEREEPRRRRPRAAIVVRNDAQSILAALVLARDRRHIVFFYVCEQEGLMDFFRGKATDLEENADLLLVGFTAQPLPREVISSAALYRGRLDWFDHQEWPVEDIQAMREAIGEESLILADGASSSLVAVTGMTERRSRFTDKLLDLSGHRLSENDMEKWGYRLTGLIQRMGRQSGDYRSEISPVLSGKPGELAEVDYVYSEEMLWLERHDPRIVHFGEYQMAVVESPESLDAGELARRLRLKTGARLSLSFRQGHDLVTLGCNEEKRHLNVQGAVDHVASAMSWATGRPGGDRVGRFRVEGLAEHPERFEEVIGEIVRHKLILYG